MHPQRNERADRTPQLRKIAVVSPHLDDATFSVGAFIHQQARRGAQVLVVTVLANDPAASGQEAGSWDRTCGFHSAAAAAGTRREEDRRACIILGATPRWLPYGDITYGRNADDEEIWADVSQAIGDADAVLVPGYPLTHPDHLWVATLVIERRNQLKGRLGLYAEQPYTAGTVLGRRHTIGSSSRIGTIGNIATFAVRVWFTQATSPMPIHRLPLEPKVEWQTIRTSFLDRRAKRRAVQSYRSQLRPLGALATFGARLYEFARRGETITWVRPA